MPKDPTVPQLQVMIATPCAQASVSMHYAASLFDFSAEATRTGLKVGLQFHSESLITRARNHMVAAFLADDAYTHLLWIDADVSFRPDSVFRLLRSRFDVTAGIYPLKVENWPKHGVPAVATRQDLDRHLIRYPFYPAQAEPGTGAFESDEDGFVEVLAAPTGFMAITRRAFVRLAEHYPELAYVPDPDAEPVAAGLHWRFFDCMVDPDSGHYLSEDYAFCRRWRDIGGTIHADVHSKLGHLGLRLFQGNLAHAIGQRRQ